mgnify:CR=1 FL=1
MNLPATIAAEIRRQVEEGALEPGHQLPGHRDLAAQFEVSMGSVREAISLLVGDGVLEVRAGRGTFVAQPARFALEAPAPLSLKEIEELIEAREILELQIAALAAERATAAQVARLHEALDAMATAAADASAWPDRDVDFHLALAAAAGNRYLYQAMHDFRSLLRQDMELAASAAIRRFGSLEFSVESHRAIVAAIEAGDAEQARQALFAIMSRHHEFVTSLYGLAEGQAPEPATGAAAPPPPRARRTATTRKRSTA